MDPSTDNRLQAAIRNIANDPINVIRTAQDAYQRAACGFRERQREILASAYTFAMYVRDKPELIANFYAEPFFNQKKRRPKDKAILRMAICFALGSLSGPEYRRAMALAYVLQPDFDKHRTPKDVAEDLRTLGIFKLRARRLPNESKAGPARPLDEIDNGELLKGIDPAEIDRYDDFHEAEDPSGEEEEQEEQEDEDEKECDEEQVYEDEFDEVKEPAGHSREKRSKLRKRTKKQQAVYDLLSAVNDMLDGWDGSPVLLLEAGQHINFASPLEPQLGRSGTIRYVRKRLPGEFVHMRIENLEPD